MTKIVPVARMTRLAAISTAFAVFSAITAPGEARQDKPSEPRGTATSWTPSDKKSVPVTFAGMKVAIDPETGKLRPPTPEEAQALSQAMDARFRTAPLREVKKADGTVMMDLQGQFLEASVVTRNADGTFTHRCSAGEKPHDALPPPAASARSKKAPEQE